MVEKNRYVFWYDEGGQEKEFATNINMPGISVLTLEGNPFTIKYQIQTLIPQHYNLTLSISS